MRVCVSQDVRTPPRGRAGPGAAGPEPPDGGGAEHHPVGDGEAAEGGGEGTEHAQVRGGGANLPTQLLIDPPSAGPGLGALGWGGLVSERGSAARRQGHTGRDVT